jgi:16S rRNA (guanine527-N7)-methyltransferase
VSTPLPDGPVSRETGPSGISEVRDSPSDNPDLHRYAEILLGSGIERGLIGPREAGRIWDRHINNCGGLEALIRPGSHVCDVGSGAGLPGMVLAIIRPDLHVTLVEPLARRVTFLKETARDLGLANVEIQRARATDLHHQTRFDVVTARAVAPLPKLVHWCMPLVDDSGELLAMKGESGSQEVLDATPLLTKQGCAPPTIVAINENNPGARTTVVRVRWSRSATASADTHHSHPGHRADSGDWTGTR